MSWRFHLVRKPEPGGAMVALCQERGKQPVVRNPEPVWLTEAEKSPLDSPRLCADCREKALQQPPAERFWEYGIAERRKTGEYPELRAEEHR